MFSSNTTQESGGYEIQRSLRFNGADSAYLNRTFSSTGNRKTWTWSGWIKRSTLSVLQALFGSQQGIAATPRAGIQIEDTNAITFIYNSTGLANSQITTTAVYRDVSAWYHVVLAVDTTQATSSNRLKLYVNGVQVTSFTTADYPILNEDLPIGINTAHMIGSFDPGAGADRFFRGYMTEVNFIDGQALTPSSFGEYNADTGVWQPKRYGGSYGTNGFYLNFSDNSNTTAATLGADYSGNGNNWTPNNFSVSAGTGNDSLVDVPTNWGVDTGVGGTVRGNYCTLNPLDKQSGITLANGNLDVTASGTWVSVRSTFGMTSGKWYWETTFNGFQIMIGIGTSAATLSNYIGADTNGWAYYFNGQKFTNSTGAAYGASYTTGDIIGIAFDADTGSLTFYNNGTSQGVAFTGLTSGPYFPALGLNDATPNTNFGQRPFAYTAPSGFKALNTQNLPTPTIGATTATTANKFFDVSLWTGNDGAQTIANSGSFQPDLIWAKCRSNGSTAQAWTDAVRGSTALLTSDSNGAEQTIPSTWVNPASNGIALNTTNVTWNGSGRTYVGWQWRASNATAVTNTAGSITSTVSANTTSGFSVVTWTTDGTTATVGHGLGVAPKMIIVKQRNATSPWYVFTTVIDGSYDYLVLNSDDAKANSSYAAPTSTVFEYNDDNAATQVAYCFAEVPGYSRFGSYTGNGSTDGPFVFTGMRPAFIMTKRTDVSGFWWEMVDMDRSPTNVSNKTLYANVSDAEYTNAAYDKDLLSNGFKMRGTNGGQNASGGTYIFMAFAENPFKYSLAR